MNCLFGAYSRYDIVYFHFNLMVNDDRPHAHRFYSL